MDAAVNLGQLRGLHFLGMQRRFVARNDRNLVPAGEIDIAVARDQTGEALAIERNVLVGMAH